MWTWVIFFLFFCVGGGLGEVYSNIAYLVRSYGSNKIGFGLALDGDTSIGAKPNHYCGVGEVW